MRDGLYKNPVIPARWSRVLRSVGREAERGTSTPQRLSQQAMEGDVRLEVTKAFLKSFKQLAAQSNAHLPGLGRFSTCGDSRELGRKNSALEKDCLDVARREERAGLCGIELAERALAAALRRKGECWIRAVEQQMVGKNAGDVVRGFAEAVRCLDFEKMASSLLSGASSLETRKVREPLDLDEDLRVTR